MEKHGIRGRRTQHVEDVILGGLGLQHVIHQTHFHHFLLGCNICVAMLVDVVGHEAVSHEIHSIIRGPYEKAFSYIRLRDSGHHFLSVFLGPK